MPNRNKVLICFFAILLLSSCANRQAEIDAQNEAIQIELQRQARVEAENRARQEEFQRQAQIEAQNRVNQQQTQAASSEPTCPETIAKRALVGAGLGVLVDCVLFGCAPLTSILSGAGAGVIEGGVECIMNKN